MGRTVYGVDLEESPFGGLIEELLTEEELEKLADGGAPGGRGAAPDGGGDDEVESDTTESEADDDAGSSETRSWSPSSPPPSTARDDESGGYGSGSRSRESTGFGPGTGTDEDEGDASFLSKHRWLLLKVAVAFAVLATVGVVLWRYKDRLTGLVPGRGGDDTDEFDVDATGAEDGGADVSPARRRARVGGEATGRDDDRPPGHGGGDGDDGEHGAPPQQSPRRDEGVETPGEDLDLGALVGLGALALVAALVRKYDEKHSRPHDPLADGPLDGDENEDDDQ